MFPHFIQKGVKLSEVSLGCQLLGPLYIIGFLCVHVHTRARSHLWLSRSSLPTDRTPFHKSTASHHCESYQLRSTLTDKGLSLIRPPAKKPSSSFNSCRDLRGEIGITCSEFPVKVAGCEKLKPAFQKRTGKQETGYKLILSWESWNSFKRHVWRMLSLMCHTPSIFTSGISSACAFLLLFFFFFVISFWLVGESAS